MKVLTKLVEIENQKFVLIEDEVDGRKFYGTIPYSELDENGRMKRALNGFELCMDFAGASQALENRKNRILVDAYRQNHTKEETLQFMLQLVG